ncbi:MAG: ImmA/IrrE family metallo-endopeptidase, partial [Candidatus Dadabacteria bacterium]|nr:ImmA/IrrE family metallo-endopeptidase [Candidatus Dadabacteria bacterium]
ARKARTFSLFHELGHLLRNKSEIAHWGDSDQGAETWCDELAANVLMPSEEFRAAAQKLRANNLKNIGKIAKSFKVSHYACLVRMKQLEIIGSDTYQDIESQLQRFYEQRKKDLKEKEIPLGRNRADEVLDQYGHIYTRALFQIYHNNEIGLHKLCRLFGLKRASDALQLEKNL